MTICWCYFWEMALNFVHDSPLDILHDWERLQERKQRKLMVRNIITDEDSRLIFIRSYIRKPQINTYTGKLSSYLQQRQTQAASSSPISPSAPYLKNRVDNNSAQHSPHLA
jgi:hypothetical protein